MLGIAIVLSFLFATYVFSYENAQQQVRYDGCYGQDRGQSFDPIVAAQQYVNGEGNPKARDHHNYVQAGEPLDKSMAVACQANAIMRASMRIQILVYAGSLIPLLIGLVAAFVGVIQFISGSNQVEATQIRQPELAHEIINNKANYSVKTRPQKSHLFSFLLLYLTIKNVLAKDRNS